ncbi:MNIO family bufferin maturase [Pseudomonas sp. RA_15y_Pfl2_54]|uniref:MNIO family bufferin maturase n=1 Tax=Pseudomonas sp. RA_15y_Pfl2_54 TaxID=3088704 RepID=UPI0030D9D009
MFTSPEPALPCTQAAHTGLPARAGLGLKTGHFREVLGSLPDIGFFEVHAENYMVAGGPFHHFLGLIRQQYPLSLHGVGLSIGAEGALDDQHLQRLAVLIERYQPQSFSEHLAWSSHGPVFLNDLLPLAYDMPTLNRVCDHIDQVQNTLKRPMLLENPATYLAFQRSSIDEPDFIAEVIRRSGCGLLLDVNNIHVSCVNHQRDPLTYLDALPLQAVGEIHLAGFAEDSDSLGERLLIDDHGAPIDQAVWGLYRQVLERIGPVATLIERDNQVPAFDVLLAEAQQADDLLTHVGSQP